MLSRFIKKSNSPIVSATPSPLDDGLAFTIRLAYPDDAVALRRLAAMDSQRPLSGRILVAEVAAELWAAVSIEEGRAVADPFRRTATLVRVLEAQAAASVLATRTGDAVRVARRPAAAVAR